MSWTFPVGKFLWQFAVIELKILVCRFESEMVPKWVRTWMCLNLKVYEACVAQVDTL